MIPTMFNMATGLLEKIEKAFKILQLDKLDKKYTFGETISMVDIECIWWYLWACYGCFTLYRTIYKTFFPTYLKFQ